jgi:hypothetical protein
MPAALPILGGEERAMGASYHYRVEVATGYAEEVRSVIEVHASVASHNDGSIAAHGNDTTVLAVVADGFEGLFGLKAWADSHRAEQLNLITAVGTPMIVRDTDLASLRSSVETHPELEPGVLEGVSSESAWRFEWSHGRQGQVSRLPRTGRGPAPREGQR